MVSICESRYLMTPCRGGFRWNDQYSTGHFYMERNITIRQSLLLLDEVEDAFARRMHGFRHNDALLVKDYNSSLCTKPMENGTRIVESSGRTWARGR